MSIEMEKTTDLAEKEMAMEKRTDMANDIPDEMRNDMAKGRAADPYEVMSVCLLAGKIMLQSGAETYRVEDTMMRMARAFGVEEVHSYTTPTGIIFSIETGKSAETRMVRVTKRTVDLEKVAQANGISRQIASGRLTIGEAYSSLKELEGSEASYSTGWRLLAAAISSGCFLILFQGEWRDFPAAFLSGGVGYGGLVLFHRLVPVQFFAEFLASLLIGLFSFFWVQLGVGISLDKIVIGSVMPLVPGLLLTNALRDLVAGHLVSGVTKGAEAVLTAFAIGSGVAVVLSFL